jgi:hypothetical protein
VEVFGHLREDIKFPEIESRAEAEMLDPELWLVSRDEEIQNHHTMHKLTAAEANGEIP